VNKQWLSILVIILLSAAVGFGIAWKLKPNTNSMTMMVLNGGKVYPSPQAGDVLHWIRQGGATADVRFIGPGSPSTLSPCTESRSTDPGGSPTCTVKSNLGSANRSLYLYSCKGCGDPGVPIQNATVTLRKGAASDNTIIVNSYIGQVASNQNQSGVWYGDGFTTPIPVATYPAGRSDAVQWIPTPNGNWKVVVSDGTCSEGKSFSNGGKDTCTVQSTARSQNYCVIYGTNSPGYATLIVNGNPAPPLPIGPPPANCALP